MKLKHYGTVCGVVSAVVLCTGIVRAQGTNETGSGRGAFREEIKSYFEEQKAEDKAFRAEEKGVTNLEEKISDIIQHREKQYAENKAEFAKVHGEVMANIKAKMAKNNRLTASEQTEVTNFFETQYQENVTFRDAEEKTLISGLQALDSQQGLSKESAKEQIKSLFEKCTADRKSHRETQEAAREAFMKKFRAEVKASKGSASGGGSTSSN